MATMAGQHFFLELQQEQKSVGDIESFLDSQSEHEMPSEKSNNLLFFFDLTNNFYHEKKNFFLLGYESQDEFNFPCSSNMSLNSPMSTLSFHSPLSDVSMTSPVNACVDVINHKSLKSRVYRRRRQGCNCEKSKLFC